MSSKNEQAEVNLKKFATSDMMETFNKFATKRLRNKRRKSKSSEPEIEKDNNLNEQQTSVTSSNSEPKTIIKKANTYNRKIKRIPLL
jgi:hypothetical protein